MAENTMPELTLEPTGATATIPELKLETASAPAAPEAGKKEAEPVQIDESMLTE